jgi:PilZ domain
MNPRQNAQIAEPRAAPRERLFLAARLIYAKGAMSTPCTVTQLSVSGARINLGETVSLPETFEISIPQRDFSCRARLVWRDGGRAGIEFQAEAPPPEPTTADYMEKIRALEALNAKFKAQIAEMTTQLHRLTDEG